MLHGLRRQGLLGKESELYRGLELDSLSFSESQLLHFTEGRLGPVKEGTESRSTAEIGTQS